MATRSGLVGFLDRWLYPGRTGAWYDLLLREEVMRHIKPDHVILDLGAGAGVVPEMNFRGIARKVCGVDPTEVVANNPHLDEAKVGCGERIPYPPESFDLAFADNVLEHLSDPARVFAELHRVLKPGGVFLAKTPNRLHYMASIASLTPMSFHRFYKRRMGRQDADTFPTLYRANTVVRLRQLAADAGFSATIRSFEGRPEYLRVYAVTYPFGILYERLVNRFDALAAFRCVLLAVMRK